MLHDHCTISERTPVYNEHLYNKTSVQCNKTLYSDSDYEIGGKNLIAKVTHLTVKEVLGKQLNLLVCVA
jgi:hypothetical protein